MSEMPVDLTMCLAIWQLAVPMMPDGINLFTESLFSRRFRNSSSFRQLTMNS